MIENKPLCIDYCTVPWNILVAAVRSFFKDNCLNLSAAVAFYSIISVIPILFLIFYASGVLLGSSEKAYIAVIEFVRELYPYVEEKLIYEIKRLSDISGSTGWIALAFLLWISTMFVTSLESAFNIIFRVEDTRHRFRSLFMGAAVIPVGLAAILYSIVVNTGELFLKKWAVGSCLVNSAMIRYILPLSVIVAFFTIIYLVIPNKKISFQSALMGGALSAVFLEIAKYFFKIYLSLGGNPAGFVYGSLIASVYVVIWVFYLAAITLFTAEIVSAVELRKGDR